MRWFYAPNEQAEGDQVGPRMAFELLHSQGILTDYCAYSYLVRKRELGRQELALRDFVDAARAFAPDVIFIQHVNRNYPIDRAFLQTLKNLPSRPKLVAHEGDPYDWMRKQLDSQHKLIFAEADMTILVGLGSLRELVQKTGTPRIRLFTHSYDSKRFGLPWQPTLKRQFDAVMIANLPYFKRIPGVYLPGGRERRAIADSLFSVLGKRVAVFGNGQGWVGRPYAKGSIPFDRQGEVIRDSWMTFNWHHFDNIAMYSSDRLQISLACGVPHITNWQPGYEHMFQGIPGLFVVKSPREAADVALYLMSKTAEQLNEVGAQAAAYARRHFEAKKVYADIVCVVAEQLLGRDLASNTRV